MNNIIKPKIVDFENVPTTHVIKTGKKTPDFYKGTSFRWRREWEPGRSYVNDDYHVDLVYHKGKSWICTKSHISDAENAPSEDVSVWELAVNQSGSGIHIGDEPPTEEQYGSLYTDMLWLDTSVEEDSLKVYSASEVDLKLEALDSECKNRWIELSNAKANKATTLSGYGIIDSYTKTEVDNIKSDLEAYADQAETDAIAASKSYVDGLKIAKTYATKTEMSNLANTVDSKADKNDTYNKSDIDSKNDELNSKIDDKLGKYETASNASKLNGQNSSYYATKQSVDSLKEIVNKKADSEDVDTKSEVDKKIQNAFNKFATDISTDGVVNTYKELIDYASEHSSEFVALVGELSEAQNDIIDLKKNKIDKIVGKGLSTNDFTDEYKKKVDEFSGGGGGDFNKEGYYPDMSVGMADNLVGRGDVQDAQINFRPSAGADNITDVAARIERIKGNSVVWNQGYPSKKVVIDIDNSSGTSAKPVYLKVDSLFYAKANSYYYCAVANCKFNHSSTIIYNGYLVSQVVDLKNEPSIIFSNADRTSVISLYAQVAAGVIEHIECEPIVVNLTKMFGAGNEPTTVEEYYQRKPMNIEDEFAYNEGELIDMKVDSLVSVSDNAFDYTKGYARVMGGVPYTITVDNRKDITPEEVYFSDTLPVTTFEENIIYPNADGTYTFPSIGYAKASFVGYEVGKENTICICLKHSYDKPHPAYQQEVKDLGWVWEIQDSEGNLLFPNGMRGIPAYVADGGAVIKGTDIYDEIRYNPTTKKWEAVQRVGKATNLTFANGGTNIFAVLITDLKRPSDYASRRGGFVANKYNSSDPVSISSMDDKSILRIDSVYNIYIKDTTYSTVAEFNEANKDLVIYYELAEPIVVELDYPTAETNMDYMTWDFGTEEAIASVPSAPFRAGIQYGDNFVDDIRKNKDDIATNKANIAKNTSALNSKQNTLTLTTKPNGNIVIGNLAGQSKEFMPATPSGDPMHYAYLKVYGLSYDETTGLWAYRADEGGLTDLTTEEVQNMWLVAGGLDGKNGNYCRWAKRMDLLFPARTNICSTYYGEGQGYANSDWNFAFNQNPTIEVAVITAIPTYSSSVAQPYFCAGMFAHCYKLRKIIGGLSFLHIYKNDSRYTNMFTQCPLLESVEIWELNRNLGFPHSPLLSKESLLFMINNCASNATFTITLHPDVYAKCTDADNGEWYDDVVNAIDTVMTSKGSTIILASA